MQTATANDEQKEVSKYCERNNLPEFLTTWLEVSDYTGTALDTLLRCFTEPEPTPEPKKGKTTAPATLESMIAAAITPFLKLQQPTPQIDEGKIIELIKNFAPIREIHIKQDNKPTHIIEGLQHKALTDILLSISAGNHCYLVGPAGTGKTRLAHTAAKSLGLPYYSISVCGQSTKSEFFSYRDANGNCFATLFRQAYENGGVFLIDEIDGGNANVLMAINSALANGHCAFPDGMVNVHKDFICIAAGNTFGTGSDRLHIGTNQLNAATLDRFEFIEVNYDEELERNLYPEIAADIQAIRRKLEGERAVISLRGMERTARLMAAGLSKKDAIQRGVINSIPKNLHSKL